jgi:FecR protein
MKVRFPYALVLTLLLSVYIATPADIVGAPQASSSRAGEVTRVIPEVNIARGLKTVTASAKSVVDWEDLVKTQINGRARIALDDGSVLNIGSQSSMHVVKHDPGAQQTDLELIYGKLRAQAVKINKPDGKFEVHTPVGVAGVVGTDFYVGYDSNTMSVIVFEGVVRVCNLAGVCVEVKAGQMSSVRNADNSAPPPPLAPQQAALDFLTQAAQSTDVGQVSGAVLTGMVVDAEGAQVGVSSLTNGASLYTGDVVSTSSDGHAQMRVRRSRFELIGQSSGAFFPAVNGAVAELRHGTMIAALNSPSETFEIFASDVRIVPKSERPILAQITMNFSCDLQIRVQHGSLEATVVKETKTLEEGHSYDVIPEVSVIYSRNSAISPDESEYHRSHKHAACALAAKLGQRPAPAGSSHFNILVGAGVATAIIIPILFLRGGPLPESPSLP